MGVFTAWHSQTDNRSKFLLLFNLFFFIYKFQLAIYIKGSSFCLNYDCSGEFFFFLLEIPVNVNQYRAAIGVFNNRSFITTKKSFYVTEINSVRKMALPFLANNMMILFFFFFFMFTVYFHQKYRKNRFKLIVLTLLVTVICFYHTWLYIWLVNFSGDVKKNPGPKSYSARYLTICHWNLNSIAAHNFMKAVLLKAYLSVHNMDTVYLSETYLDYFVLTDDGNLKIPGYSSIRADHPSNTKLGGVLVYYNSYLPSKLIDVKYSHECINFELRIGGNTCKFLSLYRSPSQNRDEFEKFLENLELSIDHMTDKNPYMMVVFGDFKGTVMQIEKSLINDRLRVSKVS